MKVMLAAVIFLQLLGMTASHAQNELKDKLKLLESSDLTVYQVGKSGKKTKKRQLDIDNVLLHPSLDSVIVFVLKQKQLKTATFESHIQPYLIEKLTPGKLLCTDFSDDEEIIFDSFLKVMTWENIPQTTVLYSDFIVWNCKETELFESLLRVLSYVREVHVYACQNPTSNAIAPQLNETFKNYNSIDWMVFLKQPDALLLWLTAAYAWNSVED